jgi:competence protein ComEA
MKRILKEYFTFSKKERIAVVILLVLMSGFIAAPYLYEPETEMPVMSKELADFLAGRDSVEKNTIANPAANTTKVNEKKEAVLFPFDPNTIDAETWERLGISKRTARTIINYRNKGGKFRSPEDIRKIWGLHKDDAERLIPYVVIAGSKPSAIPAQQIPVASLSIQKQTIPIDINTAGVEEWKSLPGIGEVLAARVVKFRDKIGGFLSVEQVRKTYGISDSLFSVIVPYLVFKPSSLPRLNLNTASVYELRSRTGISYQLAKAIVDIRNLEGPYQDINTLKTKVPMPDSVWQRITLLIKTE